MAFQAFDTAASYLNELITAYYRKPNERASIINPLAEILDHLNHMHPFREGNGRTQREVIRVLALSKGFFLEINVAISDDIYHLYMDSTVYEKRNLSRSYLIKSSNTKSNSLIIRAI